MIRWKMGGALLMAAALAACGSNKTSAGITIFAASATSGATSVTVPINGTEQFGAAVTGISTTTVRWQVCLPAPLPSDIPTKCTTIPGVTPPQGSTPLTGYGTISQNGLYTAPSAIPAQNDFLIVATSPADAKAFATFGVIIDSGVRVSISPALPTIRAGESIQFVATVTGTPNTAVTWEVSGVAGGNSTDGFICPSPSAPVGCSPGQYFSPANASGAKAITALSAADGTTSASTSVSLFGSDPAVSGIEPRAVPQGAAAEQVYVVGSNFTSNGFVLVDGVPLACYLPGSATSGSTPPPCTYISPALVRVQVPSTLLIAAGTIPVAFQLQGSLPPFPTGNISGSAGLTVMAVGPSIVASSSPNLSATTGTASLNITGGFFLPATAFQFDGGNEGAVTAAADSTQPTRRMNLTLPANSVATPGLYSITAGNPGVPAGQPSLAATNVAVTPAFGVTPIPSAPTGTITLGGGTQPSAIAMDWADGLAVVAETGANAVALVDMSSKSVVQTIPVGNQPTGVAVDDMLPHPLALVVNSGGNTVSVIDLTTRAPFSTPTVSLAGFTPTTARPFAIGINPLTHRAIVANASTNQATIIDLVNANTNVGCAAAPCPLTTVGGSTAPFGTGPNPNVAMDTGLNWAVVTPGGAGVVNLVDLGFGSSSPGSGGRAPAILGTLTLSTSIQGVGVNSETHEALFTDFLSGGLYRFSLLDNTVASITSNGSVLSLPQESAAAVDPLQDIGIAVNEAGSGTASIVDLGNRIVLQTVANVTDPGGSPQAAAIDPATNQALVADTTAGKLSFISLGSSPVKPLQILESSPGIALTSATSLALTINGSGFVPGSSVLLDGAPLASVTYNSSRQLTAVVPPALLGAPHRFAVQVQNPNPGGSISNVAKLTIAQAINVGTSPGGLGVDVDRDLAVVANSGSGNVSLVSLAPPAIAPESLGPVGVIGSPLVAHLNPRAVAVDSRLGLAVVANFDSNDLSLVDYSQVFSSPYALPARAACASSSTCTGPVGAAFDDDSGGFAVTDTNIGAAQSDVTFGTAVPPTASAPANFNVNSTPQPVDQTPGDLAIAPSFDPANPQVSYAAIASAAQTSVIDFMNTASEVVVGRTTGVVQPAGVVYDWLNNTFLVSDGLNNSLLMVSPLTFVPTAVRAGFNPVSIAYNPQTSTVVAVNGATGTLSILDYLCPPSAANPGCTAPQVRTTIGLVGSQLSSAAPLGPKLVGIDPRQNLAVLVDAQNNRILLIPLP